MGVGLIIYKVTNILNGKIYIGQTTKSLEERKKCHVYGSKNGKRILNEAIRKYGKENFLWEVIYEGVSKEDLDEKEKFFIDKFKSLVTQNGYNIFSGGNGHTEESKNKIKKSLVNKIVSNETKLKISIANKGKKRTEDMKLKMSTKRKGLKKPKGFGKKISYKLSVFFKNNPGVRSGEKNPMFGRRGILSPIYSCNHPRWGKHCTDETKEKISKANKISLKGRVFSTEHKIKLKEWADKRVRNKEGQYIKEVIT